MNASQEFVCPPIENILYLVSTLEGRQGDEWLMVWAGWDANQADIAKEWAKKQCLGHRLEKLNPMRKELEEPLNPILKNFVLAPDGIPHVMMLYDDRQREMVGFFFSPFLLSPMPVTRKIKLADGSYRFCKGPYPVCDIKHFLAIKHCLNKDKLLSKIVLKT